MKNLEHIGIATGNLETAIPLYEKLLNTHCYKQEEVASEGVRTAFFRAGEAKIELLEGFTEDSAITKFVAKKGNGLHHVAFEVEDIRKEMERLRQNGFQLLNNEPKAGADNKLVCFVHPRSSGGVLVELCQEIR
ncbi:MAG TPA: methylmalonyl-CoA epimerase [Edaphocola sp.]|nr:methylmalonyl-CoA epimerase [Edaphocola sp.]